jgi:hypothetical protein
MAAGRRGRGRAMRVHDVAGGAPVQGDAGAPVDVPRPAASMTGAVRFMASPPPPARRLPGAGAGSA